ncbi:hypothetical protein C7U92_10290 [Bradyrhizobium sp. WBOS7]|uniref:Uncharacterized protein n=1 Tax=Bradyrhizobium betae TaxID=244734 RepID=A0AAE9N835_9BRAD|nr:hypothetical protein [Bradyrhizobium sp. WBOS1]MDD1577118.1 hypothetical protein [Bradyrhizobium sp. WBOS7]MDD1600165.1 hypothetical protein [Bradyrhizobium sp. WBOS16]UUO33993.1 hypothetical protein DCK84_05000 [Bradyrhizobium sp. WBOS01]UUO40526.1 hypothetical protein DCM75_07035 [Bradyrhizobium sp. WBOS02]UUO52691.1 hypothetical protein DCM79_06675 [Bradyrhizobium sp. WBOS07]UUO64817.1 hypothetical protein DCM83_06050 [Bradyrhizobium betae]
MLCYLFGSTDGTLRGIANPFDRRRCEARIEYERGYARIWQNDATRSCETAEDLEEQKRLAHLSFATLRASNAELLKRPILLRGRGRDFCEPFKDWMPLDDYDDVGFPSDLATTPKFVLNDARKEYLAVRWHSPDGTARNVPDGYRSAFDEQMEYHTQALEANREDIAKHYGSPYGSWRGIPQARLAAANRYARLWLGRFESRCEFELALLRVTIDEMDAEELDRKADELIESIERQIEDVAQDILQNILDEQGATS